MIAACIGVFAHHYQYLFNSSVLDISSTLLFSFDAVYFKDVLLLLGIRRYTQRSFDLVGEQQHGCSIGHHRKAYNRACLWRQGFVGAGKTVSKASAHAAVLSVLASVYWSGGKYLRPERHFEIRFCGKDV